MSKLNLKGIFPSDWFKEDTPPESNENNQNGEPSGAPVSLNETSPPQQNSATPVFNVIMADTPDAKYSEHIVKVLAEKNLAGIDYYEFSAAVRKQMGAGMLIQQAFQSTFVALEAAGLTIEKLISSNESYNVLLKEMEDEFYAEADGKINTTKLEVEKNVTKLNNHINDSVLQEQKLLDQLKQLKEQRDLHTAEIAKQNQDLTQTVQNQETRKTKMKVTVNHFLKVIQDDLVKIKEYLNPQTTNK